ncbi:MAG: Bax inhibitor-1 family protein [Clostridiaceae bacterium]
MENKKVYLFSESLSTYMTKIYGWMSLALALSGFVAFFTSTNETLMIRIYQNPMVLIGLVISQFALVFLISAGIRRISTPAATAAFLVYSVLNGFTLSYIFILYASSTIFNAFFITAGTFAVFSIYGLTTKKDLTGLGSLLFMGLIGIIIASLVNMFFASSMMTMIISYVAVLIFVGLTAYDTQKLKEYYYQSNGSEFTRNLAIVGALMLYLDFINLFLNILRILNDND